MRSKNKLRRAPGEFRINRQTTTFARTVFLIYANMVWITVAMSLLFAHIYAKDFKEQGSFQVESQHQLGDKETSWEFLGG